MPLGSYGVNAQGGSSGFLRTLVWGEVPGNRASHEVYGPVRGLFPR